MWFSLKYKYKLGWLTSRFLFFLAIIGPGLITASADNDAPGIATYSMAGSAYGYAFLWVLLFVTLGESVVQEMAARMGAVTGKGLADLIRERFGVRVAFFAMLCLILANLGTTAAQFAGVAASLELVGITRYLAVPVAAFLVWLLVVRGSYHRVEKVLIALSLFSLSYVISAFLMHLAWGDILRQTVMPSFRLDSEYILVLLAIVGTTITPWGAFYLQATVVDKGVNSDDYPYARLDILTGVVFGNVVSAFIVICTAAKLFGHTVVNSAAEAAMALVPLAGPWAGVLFGVGLMGASLLAASVLPLSTTYAVCEAFGWERGINREAREAPLFYGLYTLLIIVSAMAVLLPGIPLFRLMWLSQSFNAILLPVILVLMLRIASNPRIMGRHVNPRWVNAVTWGTTVLITLATLLLFAGPMYSVS